MKCVCLFRLLLLAAAVPFVFAASAASAIGFDGHTIGLQAFSPDRTSPISNLLTAQVGPGVEFSDLRNAAIGGASLVNVNIDLTATSITWDFSNTIFALFGGGGCNCYVFSDPFDELPDFAAVAIDPATTLGLTSSRISFTANEIVVNVANLSFNPSTFAKIDVQFVPEPTSALLMGLGLVGLGAKRRTN